MRPLLCLRNVNAEYGKTRVIDGVSLSVRRGEILSLIGPNGAGKTTLSKLMCRVMRPTAGSVELDGRDVWQIQAKHYARHVAHVRQSEKLAWSFTVEQVVLMGRFAHRGWMSAYKSEDHRVVEKTLEMTGLRELKHRTVDTLSGGEAQRTMLARAIAQDPRLLVLDEPVAHLDIKHQLRVLDMVRCFASDGRSVVVCLHDLTLTALYADRVALLCDGALRTEGRPEQVLNKKDLEAVYGTPVQISRFPGIGKLKISAIPEWAEQDPAGGENS